jgi:chemotaxis protein MotB
MARKQHHEDHVNHEAWAIPYGDLVTLLFALFTVMYAVSSVNEGKYRVLSDALNAAFGGKPRAMQPIQVGPRTNAGTDSVRQFNMAAPPRPVPPAPALRDLRRPPLIASQIRTQLPNASGREASVGPSSRQLAKMAEDLERALHGLIQKEVVVVRRTANWIEVEIKADILFASGASELSPSARPALQQVIEVLRPVSHHVRVEGYTDDVPITNSRFPSNWELSGARAATVVRYFIAGRLDPRRLSTLGFGEYRPVADNRTEDGRNRNRRVVIVIVPQGGTAAGGPGPT